MYSGFLLVNDREQFEESVFNLRILSTKKGEIKNVMCWKITWFLGIHVRRNRVELYSYCWGCGKQNAPSLHHQPIYVAPSPFNGQPDFIMKPLIQSHVRNWYRFFLAAAWVTSHSTTDWPIHATDWPKATDWTIHATDWPIHATDWPIHATDWPIHATDWPIHATDWPIHATDWPINTTDWPIHAADWPIHATNWPIHTTDWPIHATD